jgi:hypothetical protein
MVATGSLEKFTAFVGNVAQAFPEALDAVNPDAVVDNYADYLGVEGNTLRGQDNRDALRQARQQAQQQAQTMQQGMVGAEMLKNLGGMNMDGTAAGMMAAAAGGGGV